MMNASRQQDRPVSKLNLIGGRLCLDFVNTMGARQRGAAGEMIIRDEALNDCFDLIVWAHRAGAFEDTEVKALLRGASRQPSEAARVFRLALRLREALYRCFKAILAEETIDPRDLAILNEELQVASAARQIAATEEGFEWRWSKTAKALDKILWLVSDSAAELLTTGDLSRLRECGGDDCGWIFEDATRNRSRQWCDMRDCGNRDRVRRFRLRQREARRLAPQRVGKLRKR